MMTGMNHETL
jgi:hypothetical protein